MIFGDILAIEKDLNIQILWPKREQIKENILNNNSIVAKLKYKNFSMLLTGDIEEIAEQQILKEYEKSSSLKSTVLKVGHHGSKTSSIQAFLEVVNPKIALIGVGENNNFGHPNQEVLDRLRKMGTKVYRTDENAEVSIYINNKGKIFISEKIKVLQKNK